MIGCTRGSVTSRIWRSRLILSTKASVAAGRLKPGDAKVDPANKKPGAAPGFLFAAGQPTSRACNRRIAS